jgi:hypothetical protein
MELGLDDDMESVMSAAAAEQPRFQDKQRRWRRERKKEGKKGGRRSREELPF